MIEPQLDLGERQLRAERFVGAPEADVLRDDAVVPAQAQAGELQVKAARAQVFQQRLLGEIGQADLIEVKQRAKQGENQEPDGDAEPAKIDPAGPPKACVSGGSPLGALISRVGRHRQVSLHVIVKPGRELENPELSVQRHGCVGQVGGGLAAEFNGQPCRRS